MRDYIGSGHIAAITGVSPWSNPVKAWVELTTEAASPDNNAIRAGRYFEPAIAAWWSDENQKNLKKAELVRMPGKEFLGATPDYYILNEDGTRAAILEIKNTNARNSELWADDAPDYYAIQLIWQMHVTGIHKGFLCACVGGQELRTIEVAYDAEIGAACEMKAERFWHGYVVPKVCPPLDGADATTIGLIYRDITKGKELTLPIGATDFELYKRWQAEEKELAEKIEGFKNRLKVELKDAECALSNDRRWKIKQTEVAAKEYTVAAKTYKRLTIKALTEKEIKFLEEK